jgi:RNA polymerase sigma-70 factor (ECF subfamily)
VSVHANPATDDLPSDAVLVERLRARDETTFALLLDRWSPGMRRAAAAFVSGPETAEDVVQDTWLAVIRGVDGFEARSSLRTWVYRILINIAKTRGLRESRTVPVAGLGPEDAGPTVDPGRFQDAGGRYPGHWREPPQPWPTPETEAMTREARRHIEEALVKLPHRQRIVITLRDVDGYTSDEVCQLLEISPANQRVLLHRARAAVRARLENYFARSTVGEVVR